MKALIIGGTGTISTAVVERALAQGWEVAVLNRGSNPGLLPRGCELLQADIRDEQAVSALLRGRRFDTVADYLTFDEADAARAIRLFGEITSQYIFVSSATVYQKPPVVCPVTEGCGRRNPYSDYAQRKLLCEDVFLRAWRESGFPCTIVRPSHTYGERKIPVAFYGKAGSWQVVERMMRGKPVLVHGDGTSLWTLTHNTDFAKGFVGLMGNTGAMGECYHITSDEALSWNAVYETIGAAVGVKPQLVHVSTDYLVACDDRDYGLRASLLGDKAHTTIMDNSKIKSAVPDFVCTTRFDQGVRQCLAYLDAHPAEKVPDPAFDHWCDWVVESLQSGIAQYGKDK